MADSYFLLYEKSELSLSKFGETLFIVFTLEWLPLLLFDSPYEFKESLIWLFIAFI